MYYAPCHRPQFTPLQVWAATLKVSELVPAVLSARVWPAWSCLFHSLKKRRMKMCLREDIGASFCKVQNQHRWICISPFPMKGKCLMEGIGRGGRADLSGLQFVRWDAGKQTLSVPPPFSPLRSITSMSSLVIQWHLSVAVTVICNDQ